MNAIFSTTIQKNSLYIIVTLLFLALPFAAHGQICSQSETTIVYVNGMFGEGSINGDNTAKFHSTLIKSELKRLGISDLQFDHAFNPSHFDGVGEMVKVLQQSMISANQVEDHDFHTMVRHLHERIGTNKMVLVGHSQGTFYTNALRNYFIAHGTPPESIGVFNIATPSEYVSGGNPTNKYVDNYFTSGTDNLVIWAREFQKNFTAQALPATPGVFLPYAEGEDAKDIFAGHNFERVYMRHAADKIIGGIIRTAQQLNAGPVRTSSCLPPDDQSNVLYYIKDGLYKTGDGTIRSAREVPTVAKNLPKEMQSTVATLSNGVYEAVYAPTFRFGERVMVAFGNAVIYTTVAVYNTSKDLVLYPLQFASSSLATSSQPSSAALAVMSPHASGVPTAHPILFSPPTESLIGDIPAQPITLANPVATQDAINWEYIPERDASYIRTVIEQQPQTPQVVSTPITGTAPGGLDTLLQSPQPIILTGGAGQGGGAPVVESATGAAAPAPLTCAPGEVLSSDGASCVISDIVCSPPEVRDATTNTCVTQDTTPPAFTVNLTGCLSQELSGENFKCHAHTDAVVSASLLVETGSAIAVDEILVTEPSITVARDAVLTATDAAGNTTTYSITLIREQLPILISEVGYPLDAQQDGMHQYIELYNPTEHTINLDGLSLQSSIMTGHPLAPQFVLPLAGNIPPRSFFLSTNNYDITGTQEDMTSPWPNLLTNSGVASHQLLLKQGSITLDSFELGCPSLSTTCHPTGHPFALERSARRGNAVDYAYSLEQNNSQFVFTADTVRFVGSPGKRNTANYIVATLQDILSKMYAPYYSNALEIPTGATASIDPGVTLTVKEGGGINVYGTLTVNGTELEPVIVESAGRWGGVSVSAGATLTASRMHIRNAGIGNSGSDNAALKNRGGIVMLSNVTLLNAQPNGFFQDDGTATLTNVSMTTDNYPESGVKVRGGTFTYSGGVLSNFSDFGFHITGTPTCTISDITITGVRSARTSGSDTICSWSNVTHNGSPL